jgi:methionyl-tRNA synthetase
LPLDRHEEWLKNWITVEHAADWKTNVLGQCKSWIDNGLQARAVTRDLDWGVQVPVPDAEGKVLYVWFDAPIGYISATKQWAINTGNDWKPYWIDKETKLVHFVGKDNIVFHCIIFPAMLKLHDYILPDNVPANEFMNLEGDKMSTSRNWKLEMQDYIDDFIKKENGGPQMADALRYYLTTILPENKDSEFTWKGFQDSINSELVSIFGNFVNRSFVLMHKLCNGKVPKFHNDIIDDKDKALITEIASAKMRVENSIETYKFRDGLFEVIDLARKGNKYLQEKEPWKKVSADKTEASSEENQKLIDNCLHLCLQLCANLAILINPYLPNTARKMCGMMKVVEKVLDWENAGSMKLLSVGYSLRAPELLFRKIDDEEVKYQVEKLKAASREREVGSAQLAVGSEEAKVGSGQLTDESKQEGTAEESEIRSLKSEISFDDFDKIDLRIGTIKAAEKVAKADKLLKLQVDLGFEERTIVSGIAQHFSPETLPGKQVIVVTNLAPRKMRGIESQGMILLAEQPNGQLIFVSPETMTANGVTVR